MNKNEWKKKMKKNKGVIEINEGKEWINKWGSEWIREWMNKWMS